MEYFEQRPGYVDTLDAHALAEWLIGDRDEPILVDWCAHAIGCLSKLPHWPGNVICSAATSPVQPHSLTGFLSEASILSGLVTWCRTSPRPPIATLLATALVIHACRYPDLYQGGTEATVDHRYRAGYVLRTLCWRGTSDEVEMHPRGDMVAAAINALTAYADTLVDEGDAHWRDMVVRAITWLQSVAPESPVEPAPPLLRARHESMPTSGTAWAVDDQADARAVALQPRAVATAVDEDGEIDPAEVVGIVLPTLPGAANVVAKWPRLALAPLAQRAIASNVGRGRVGRPEAMTDGAISALASPLRDQDTPLEARVLIPASLYAGVPLSRWRRIVLVDSVDPLTDNLTWGVLRTPLALVVPARATADLPLPPDVIASNCRVPDAHVILPLSMEVPGAQSIADWVAARTAGTTMATSREIRIAREWLDAHAQEVRSPVTPRRLATVLPEACAATGLGTAEMLLILGRARQPASHYYSATAAEVVRMHAPAINWIALRLGAPRHLPHPAPVGGTIGCLRMPEPEVVERHMAALRAIDVRRPARRPSLTERITRAANLQALVSEIALWCLGARPLPHALDALMQAGVFAFVDDKRRPMGADKSHARAVPVCDVLAGALQVLHALRTEVARFAGIESIPWPWFLIESDGAVRKASWAEIRRPLPDSEMVWNASRMWFRSALSARGVPGPIMDAWMGHGVIGHEPGLALATVAPARVDAAALGALDAMTRALGLPRLGDGA